jgi:hypothetical protein
MAVPSIKNKWVDSVNVLSGFRLPLCVLPLMFKNAYLDEITFSNEILQPLSWTKFVPKTKIRNMFFSAFVKQISYHHVRKFQKVSSMSKNFTLIPDLKDYLNKCTEKR